MPIKSFRPITPTLRFQTKLVNDDLTTDKPHKPLLRESSAPADATRLGR
jgi:large subunit ribosomal protein L2